jgi:hypothetical protein
LLFRMSRFWAGGAWRIVHRRALCMETCTVETSCLSARRLGMAKESRQGETISGHASSTSETLGRDRVVLTLFAWSRRSGSRMRPYLVGGLNSDTALSLLQIRRRSQMR